MVHHYLPRGQPLNNVSTSSTAPSTPPRYVPQLKQMTPEDSAAMERIIQLARRLAKHPSILNAISLTLRYKWSDDAAGSQMKLHERASEEELQKGLQAINDIWPTIIADEEYVGAHSRETDMLHKVFIAFEKVQNLAAALAVRRRDDFQIAAHELIGAIVVIHEVFGHALRTKHFDSVMEAQSPPAYKSINDKTPNDEQVVWKDGVSGGGEAGTWIEDAGIGGVFGCVVKKQNPSCIVKIICERAIAGRHRTVSIADAHILDIVKNPENTVHLPVTKDYQTDTDMRGYLDEAFEVRLRTRVVVVRSWRPDRYNAGEKNPLDYRN